jgi:hypothetical protein
MKNIHILPTEKPSRLHFTEFEEELIFTPKYEKLNGINITITSDEEIKEGDWFYDLDTKYVKIKQSWENSHLDFNGKKIILTTDQDLIKDGVWGIEDGFLEWFVKNPTCEYVELKGYAIILPGEWEEDTPEPKQETFKNYPVIIVRNDDKEEFIHLSNGMYRTKWGILHDSISSTPLESFDKSKFTFYYE